MMAQRMVRQLFVSDIKIKMRVLKFTISQMEELLPSRNRALEAVTGDYIVFVDNDDWLELDHIQSLYDLLKKTDADIAIGNFTQFIEDQGSFFNPCRWR